MPNLVFFPWPQPWTDLLWWQSVPFRLPIISLVLAVGVVLLAAFALRSPGSARFLPWYYLAVGLALLACNGVILL